MITLFLLTQVEIYVLAAVGAAAIIALCVKPSSRGEAREYLLGGTLCFADSAGATEAAVDIECLDNGSVLLTRRGLPRLTDTGAVSLAVSVIGFDITIEERITDTPGGNPVNTALFTFDFLGQERYHLRYNSEATATAASMTLSNRPGMHLSRPLTIAS